MIRPAVACVAFAVLGTAPVLAAPCATTGGSTALESAAEGLAAGEWCEFDSGLTASLLDSCGPSVTKVITYADSGAWDPVHRKIRFVGSPHYGGQTHLVYDEASNSWSEGPRDPSYCNSLSCDDSGVTKNGCVTHGYDNNTIDPNTGDLYLGYLTDPMVRKFDGSSWSSLPVHSGKASTGAIKFFPNRGPSGGLVSISYGDEIDFWNRSTNTWTRDTLPDGGWPTSLYHFAIEYDPRHALMWLMGGQGSTQHYRMDSSGTITRMSAAPIGLGITTDLVAADTTGGKFIVWKCSNKAWYEYDLSTDRWTSITHSMPPLTNSDCANDQDNIEVSISTYGVVMYIDYGPSPKTYLYKNTAGGSSQPTVPPPPSGLRPD